VIDPATKQAWRFHGNQLNLTSAFGETGGKIQFELSEIEKLLD